MPRNNAAIERWAEKILSKNWPRPYQAITTAHTRAMAPVAPPGPRRPLDRDRALARLSRQVPVEILTLNSEAYMAERRGVVTVTRLCKCEE